MLYKTFILFLKIRVKVVFQFGRLIYSFYSILYCRIYVCIGIHGTSQCKYWNHKDGWQKVVDYLNGQGYKVVLISKENSFGIEPFMNYPPENIICWDRT